MSKGTVTFGIIFLFLIGWSFYNNAEKKRELPTTPQGKEYTEAEIQSRITPGMTTAQLTEQFGEPSEIKSIPSRNLQAWVYTTLTMPASHKEKYLSGFTAQINPPEKKVLTVEATYTTNP